jgi:hypothetical protein
VNEAGVQKIHSLKNDTYPVAHVTMYNEHDHLSDEYAVNLFFKIKGSSKHKLRRLSLLSKTLAVGGEQEPVDSSRKVIAGEYCHSSDNTSLVNPLEKDNINYIEGELNYTIIEIAPPNRFDSSLSDDARWTMEIDPVYNTHYRHQPHFRLIGQELPFRIMHNKMIQKFSITANMKSIPKQNQYAFLGIVRLVCEQKPSLCRTISIYLNRKKKKTESNSAWRRKRKVTPPGIGPARITITPRPCVTW